MHPTTLATLFETSATVLAMCSAGIVSLVIGIRASRSQIAEASGAERIVALSRVCFAVPLAVFGALHLFGARFVMNLVPTYMPARGFWVYFVGCALIAASLSIAGGIGVRWSGLLLGINYFADTLLFAGAILALASAAPRSDVSAVSAIVNSTTNVRAT